MLHHCLLLSLALLLGLPCWCTLTSLGDLNHDLGLIIPTNEITQQLALITHKLLRCPPENAGFGVMNIKAVLGACEVLIILNDQLGWFPVWEPHRPDDHQCP